MDGRCIAVDRIDSFRSICARYRRKGIRLHIDSSAHSSTFEVEWTHRKWMGTLLQECLVDLYRTPLCTAVRRNRPSEVTTAASENTCPQHSSTFPFTFMIECIHPHAWIDVRAVAPLLDYPTAVCAGMPLHLQPSMHQQNRSNTRSSLRSSTFTLECVRGNRMVRGLARLLLIDSRTPMCDSRVDSADASAAPSMNARGVVPVHFPSGLHRIDRMDAAAASRLSSCSVCRLRLGIGKSESDCTFLNATSRTGLDDRGGRPSLQCSFPHRMDPMDTTDHSVDHPLTDIDARPKSGQGRIPQTQQVQQSDPNQSVRPQPKLQLQAQSSGARWSNTNSVRAVSVSHVIASMQKQSNVPLQSNRSDSRPIRGIRLRK